MGKGLQLLWEDRGYTSGRFTVGAGGVWETWERASGHTVEFPSQDVVERTELFFQLASYVPKK